MLQDYDLPLRKTMKTNLLVISAPLSTDVTGLRPTIEEDHEDKLAGDLGPTEN